MATYQNLTDRELSLPDIGLVAPHGTITTDKVIENQNFKLITNDDKPLPHKSEPVVVPVVPEVKPQDAPAAPEQEKDHEGDK